MHQEHRAVIYLMWSFRSAQFFVAVALFSVGIAPVGIARAGTPEGYGLLYKGGTTYPCAFVTPAGDCVTCDGLSISGKEGFTERVSHNPCISPSPSSTKTPGAASTRSKHPSRSPSVE